MLLNVFCALASAKKKVENITEQIAVGIVFGGIANTKLMINKSAKTGTLKFLVCEKTPAKGVMFLDIFCTFAIDV